MHATPGGLEAGRKEVLRGEGERRTEEMPGRWEQMLRKEAGWRFCELKQALWIVQVSERLKRKAWKTGRPWER